MHKVLMNSQLQRISIVGPTIPPGALGGDGLGFDKVVIKCFTLWAGQAIKSPPNPCSLQGGMFMWGFDNLKGQIPHPWGMSFIQNRGKCFEFTAMVIIQLYYGC